jgi:hypothetical protein
VKGEPRSSDSPSRQAPVGPASFFHVLHYHKNNVSPEDPREWIRLTNPSALTGIHVRRWRNRPQSMAERADVSNEALVSP